MTSTVAVSAEVKRVRAAIAAIATNPDVIGASEALQEIGALVLHEIESLSTEVAIARAVTSRRKRDAR